jgi:hypothetical protein
MVYPVSQCEQFALIIGNWKLLQSFMYLSADLSLVMLMAMYGFSSGEKLYAGWWFYCLPKSEAAVDICMVEFERYRRLSLDAAMAVNRR